MKRWSVVLFLLLTLVLPVASGENNSATNDTRFLVYKGETIWFMNAGQGWKMTGWTNSPGVTPSITLVAVGIFLYFLPLAVSSNRRVHADGGIFALNLFFGWSAIGGIGALMWAMGAETEKEFNVRQIGMSAMADMADIYIVASYSQTLKMNSAVADAAPRPPVRRAS